MIHIDILVNSRFYNACFPPSRATSLSTRTRLRFFFVAVTVFQPQSTWLFPDILHEAATFSSVPYSFTMDQRDRGSEWCAATRGSAKPGSSPARGCSPGRRIRIGWHGLQDQQRTFRDGRSDNHY